MNASLMSFTPFPGRPQDDDFNSTETPIGIRVVGPAETEGPMQVSVDLDGSHAASQATDQEGPVSPLFDNHHLNNLGWNFGYLTPDPLRNPWSPTSSPSCSPPPSSAGSTPDSGFLGHDFEQTSPDTNSLTLSEEEYDSLHFHQDTEERLNRREQALPALLLQESPGLLAFPTYSHDFDEGELAQLQDSVVDHTSPSVDPLSLVPSGPPESPPQSPGSVSEPVLSTSHRTKKSRRAPTPLLLPLDSSPLTQRSSISARRSHRRAVSSGNPYPSPHSSPSFEPILLHPHSVPNSTSSSMDDNRRPLDRVMYRHTSISTSSLGLPPRGTHAATYSPTYSPELRPLSPSLVQRRLARESRRRSISPFSKGVDGTHGHSRRSSSQSRSRSNSGAFADVPSIIAHGTRNVPCIGGTGVTQGPTPPATSLPSKGVGRLREATFGDQPVVYAGSTQRPSSMVRNTSAYEEAVSSSGSEDAEMGYFGANAGAIQHDSSRRREASVSSSSSSLSSDSLPLPHHSLPPISAEGPKRSAAGRTYYEGDRMTVDLRENEFNAEEDEDNVSEALHRSKGKEREPALEKRRSSYPSQASPSYPVNNDYGPPSQQFGSHLPTPGITPSNLRDEVPRTRSGAPRTRSQSQSPSRQERSRSISRHRFSPMATHRTGLSTTSSTSLSKAQAEPVAVRRSRRLSNSPTRGGTGTTVDIGFLEREAVSQHAQRPPLRRSSIGATRPRSGSDVGPTQGPPANARGSGARSRSRDIDYRNYRPYPRRDFETDEEEIESEYDDDDDDYCESERGSHGGGSRSRQRGSPSKPTYSYRSGGTKPLQGSPLKGSILPPTSPLARTHDQQLPRASTQRSARFRQDTTPYADVDATAITAGIAGTAVSPGGGTIVSGLVVATASQNVYRSVGSKNIDNASERRRKGEQKYPCKFCEKGFTTNQNRQIHQWKHTGEKPYGCKCGYGSASRSDLRRHLNRKNVNTECKALPVDQAYLNALADES